MYAHDQVLHFPHIFSVYYDEIVFEIHITKMHSISLPYCVFTYLSQYENGILNSFIPFEIMLVSSNRFIIFSSIIFANNFPTSSSRVTTIKFLRSFWSSFLNISVIMPMFFPSLFLHSECRCLLHLLLQVLLSTYLQLFGHSLALFLSSLASSFHLFFSSVFPSLFVSCIRFFSYWFYFCVLSN